VVLPDNNPQNLRNSHEFLSFQLFNSFGLSIIFVHSHWILSIHKNRLNRSDISGSA